MKKAVLIIVGSAILGTVVVAGVARGKIHSIANIMQSNNNVEHDYNDCRKTMLDIGNGYSDESWEMQPKWCRKWWSKLSDAQKNELGEDDETSVSSSQQDSVEP